MRSAKCCDRIRKWVITVVIHALGLAPFTAGKDKSRCKRSAVLSLYNVAMAVLIFVNVYLSENDNNNNDLFQNVSLLIGVAYDSVDVFGNMYICYALIRGLFRVDTVISAWFRYKNIDAKLSIYKIFFNYRHIRAYACFKLILLIVLFTAFSVLEIVCHARMNIYYTTYMWITVLLPFGYTCFVTVFFGCVSLVLYQRYWVINKCLMDLCFSFPVNEFSAIVLGNDGWMKTRVQQKNTPKNTPVYVMLRKAENLNALEDNLVKKIRTLKETHFELFLLINEFNSSFGYHFLFHFILYFFGCSINLYYVIIFHLRPYAYEQYAVSCMWAIGFFLLAAYNVFHSNLIRNESNRSVELIHKILNRYHYLEAQVQSELNSFSMQIMQCPAQVKAAGFFDLSSPLFFQFLTGVFSSVIFVVQFDKVNFPS